jgi:GH24 family phage-related lysozyme (muramidase)
MTRIAADTASNIATKLASASPPPGRHGLDIRALCRELTRWEGSCRHMYVDTRGHVTTGVGHLLRDPTAAAALPWFHRATGKPATTDEIRSAFREVGALGAGHKAGSYQRASDLVLPQAKLEQLAATRLESEFLPGLRRLCPRFDGYPLPAQRALVDMAYNLGVGGLAKFQTLIAACQRGDFAAAADACHRRSSRDERNEATRALFLDAAAIVTS